jgi:hypothetical protein
MYVRISLVISLFTVGCSESNLSPIGSGDDPLQEDSMTAAITIRPESPCSSDELVVSVQGGTPVAYVWTVDGQPSAVDGDRVEPSMTAPDQRWDVEVSIAESSEVLRAHVVVEQCGPEVHSVFLSPELPYVIDPIFATVSAPDVGGQAVSLWYRWIVDGVQVSEGASETLAAGVARKHQQVEVEVVPSGSALIGEPLRSAPVIVQNSPPTAPVIAILPTTPFTAQDFACAIQTPSTDADGDPIAYDIEWTVDGEPFLGAGWGALGGDTIPAAATDVNEVWTCTVTPHDGEVEGPSVSVSVTVRGGLYPCDGRNTGDDYADEWSMGGPGLHYGMRHEASADMSIGRIEVFTGERSGINLVSLYSHDAAFNEPSVELASGSWSMDMAASWQGADLDTCVPITAGEVSWVVWQPINGSQSTRTTGGESVSYRGSFDGGASWNGPFANSEKYKLYCCE